MASQRLDLDKHGERAETRSDDREAIAVNDMDTPFVRYMLAQPEFAHLQRPQKRLSCVRIAKTFDVDRRDNDKRGRSYRGNHRK